MKTFLISTILVGSLFAWGGLHKSGTQNNEQCGGNMETTLNTYPIQRISLNEKKALFHMREEEKLARDVYITLYKKWGLRVFRNINKAEQHHMDMVLMLLNRYNLPDDAKNTKNKIGVFNDKKIQALYNELIRIGSISRIDALKVGATVEDLDIYDLEKFITKIDNKDILFIFKNLTKGSRNHMRAFMRTIKRFGGDYTPKYISLSKFNGIIASNMERGMIR